MKRIVINEHQIYEAEKIIKDGNAIKLINAKQEIDGVLEDAGNLVFPNISNMADFVLEEGQTYDVETTIEQQNRANIDYIGMMTGVL